MLICQTQLVPFCQYAKKGTKCPPGARKWHSWYICYDTSVCIGVELPNTVPFYQCIKRRTECPLQEQGKWHSWYLCYEPNVCIGVVLPSASYTCVSMDIPLCGCECRFHNKESILEILQYHKSLLHTTSKVCFYAVGLWDLKPMQNHFLKFPLMYNIAICSQRNIFPFFFFLCRHGLFQWNVLTYLRGRPTYHLCTRPVNVVVPCPPPVILPTLWWLWRYHRTNQNPTGLEGEWLFSANLITKKCLSLTFSM